MYDFNAKRVTVMGLGHFGGGVAVARWLVGQGARVLVTDQATPEKLADSIQQLQGLPIEFILGQHREHDFSSADLVVVSPAVPPNDPFLHIAQSAGVPITTEINLFVQRCQQHARPTFVGVTGTKGKSTTASLVARMLQTRHRVHLGGNIGVSLLDKIPDIRPSDLVVLELSSFMLHRLDDLRFSPHFAILTHIGQDHISWHGSLDAYHHAKATLVRHQTSDDIVVVDSTHIHSLAIARSSRGQVVEVPRDLPDRFDLKLIGEHNQRHAHLAFCVAHRLGVSRDDARRAVRDFNGLPHRLESVATLDGVTFVNDSIATIPEAAVAAALAFPRGQVIQIVGGSDKGNDMSAMCRTLVSHCRAVLCIGQMTRSLVSQLERIKTESDASAHIIACQRMEEAVAWARLHARPGEVVLLAPGTASYGVYQNFEARGEHFRSLVRANIDSSDH
jgi:UDP-N-acetylmuramoylalanine--D-glutamate ligase